MDDKIPCGMPNPWNSDERCELEWAHKGQHRGPVGRDGVDWWGNE